MRIQKGTIIGISGHMMSGLWHLQLDCGIYPIESGYGVRSLACCFGATEGSGDLLEKIRGKEIYFSVDEFGIFAGFTPVEEASPELIEAYEKGEDLDGDKNERI